MYRSIWMFDFYDKLVGKYTSRMDPMGSDLVKGPIAVTFSGLKT